MMEHLQFEHPDASRRAVLPNSRPWRGPVEVGAKVAYFKQKSQLDDEGTAEGYRQGIVIGIDPTPAGSVWLRNGRGRVVQVAREQLHGVEFEELWTPSVTDLRLLRSAEDLMAKHAGAHDHRGPAPAALEDRIVLDPAGQPQAIDGQPLAIVPLPLPPLPEAPETPTAEVPVPAMPRTRRQKQLADMPGCLRHLPSSNQQQPADDTAAIDVQSGWFLDPEGNQQL